MRSFAKSESFLERSEKVIPLGSQTFSKSRTQYPKGSSPFFIERGKGARVWDIDGNEYIDFVSSLLSITLGHGDADVTAAVRAQLEDGVIFTLPHRLETKVAELICEMVPCAEMVRFGKNGSDATAGAVRVARAFTRRDHVVVCGYHGWQDWYIGSTARHMGVPKAVRDLTHAVPYNDLDALKAVFDARPGEIAAVIMEPMNVAAPGPGFLQTVKDMAHAAGALFVLDETITGFRFANGGAQEYFDVTPDLACFGKGLANGYPLAAICGRRDVMMLMEEIFFSFTFGGEALSLAAAKAVMEKLRAEPVVETIAARGGQLLDGLNAIIAGHDLGARFGSAGHPSWSFLTIAEPDDMPALEVKTLMMQELHQRGFLSVGSHNISYAHTADDIVALLAAYAEVLPFADACAREGSVRQHLRCDPLVPLFKVR